MTLSKKVGPLPIWVWGAAIAAGILIYYFRTNSKGAIAAGAGPTPTLDPTEGAFDFPNGISSGGLTPEGTPLTAQDINDAVSNALLPVLSVLPYASAPGESQGASVGSTGVEDTLATITALKAAGLITTLPAASTGAAKAKAQPHTTPKPPIKRVNKDPGNPRKGKVYKVAVNPRGHPKGTYHIYGAGKTATYIRVGKR